VSAPGLVAAWTVLAVALVVIVRQHLGYFRRRRPFSFAAFLETAGWIIVALVAGAALLGGFAHPGTRVMEVAAAIVGALCIAFGSTFR